jgi:hypothetical protein
MNSINIPIYLHDVSQLIQNTKEQNPHKISYFGFHLEVYVISVSKHYKTPTIQLNLEVKNGTF